MKKSDKTQAQLGIHIDQGPDLENRVMALRESGMTFKAAGDLLGITASRTRHLYLRAARRKSGRKPVWTDGLNERLASLLRWLEFSNRDEVSQAYRSGHIQRLALRERGISPANLLELEQWLEAGGNLEKPPSARSVQQDDSREAAEQR
jgi:hypothetical protein